MMHAQITRIVAALLTISAIILVPACGGSSNGTTTTDTSYNGPGSKWDFTFNSGGTFTVSKRANATAPVDFTVTGTFTTSNTGFKVLTVGAVTGTGGPTVGDVAWAIDVPGYALLLKPIEPGADQVIPMVAAGSCPTADQSSNWVIVRKKNSNSATSSTSDFFGTYSFTAVTSTAVIPTARALDNTFTDQGANNLGAVTCTNGLANVSDAQMYLTSNGGAIVHTGISTPSESSFIFALAQKAITNVANFDGTYAGMIFDGNYTAGSRVIPASMTCSGGTCNGNLLSSAQNGATTSDPWTLALTNTIDSPSSGFITGTLTDNGTTNSGNVACMIDIDVQGTGKKIISCVAQSPGDNTQMANAIFTSL